ncbi:ribonuclease J [Proteiniclasticum sp. QWL-01]|uniref:ribonuclease J n=1 Tax=Proteiniclasticum sp. QWL-01 TaxID=3036945 RepID=UPI00241143D9|nr:ribonuclease J [Proteiniclasticum sp. QWL-01]WFF74550.1 ribonuclease J [Proteiniclasticum sp. QWL-01]
MWNKPRPEAVNFTVSNPSDKDIVRIIPLGGLDEIGKNMTAIEYRDEIVVIDCGLKFPEDEMLGIDSVIPDVTFLKNNLHKVKGFFITHGHEDHIGALPHILKEVNVPVYSTRLTLGLIEVKLREHNIFNKVKLQTVKPRDIVRFNHISVEFIKTNHSIADASALAIHTAAGVLIHTGDFKVDLTPVAGDVIDLARFAELGTQGVLALMADSTNAERPGYTQSESTIGNSFEKLFMEAKGRIIVATFSSNIDRIQQVIGAALKTNRKMVFNGRSMENNVNVARELGYLDIDDRSIVPVDEIKRFRDDQLVIMTTGSQGEPMAALSRMALGEHRKIQIQPNDTVILSSHPIPGNEKGIFKTINLLYKLGAEVIYDSKEDVHVSGHACQEELKLIQALVKPKYFIPVHGEYRMLKIHSDLARKMGMESKNILIPETGDILELSQTSLRKNGKVQSGQILVDGLGVGDVGSIVLRDRKHLSEDGMVTVVVTVDMTSGTVIAGPDLISRGFVFIKEAEQLMEDSRIIVRNLLTEAEGTRLKNTEFVKNQIREQLRNFLFRRTKRSPMIVPIIMEI